MRSRTARKRAGGRGTRQGDAYLVGDVLEDDGEVDGGIGADALRVLADLEIPGDAADGELEVGLG